MSIKSLLLLTLSSCALLIACENKAEEPVASPADTAQKASPWAFLQAAEKKLGGDFNGDGRADQLYLVSSTRVPPAALADSNPRPGWPYYGDGTAPTAMADVGPLAIVIAESLDNAKSYHLIYDPNAISVLAAPAASEMFVAKQSDKQNPAWEALGDTAKGDVLVIPTEAGIDSYLGWNGSAYTAFEMLEMP